MSRSFFKNVSASFILRSILYSTSCDPENLLISRRRGVGLLKKFLNSNFLKVPSFYQ